MQESLLNSLIVRILNDYPQKGVGLKQARSGLPLKIKGEEIVLLRSGEEVLRIDLGYIGSVIY